MNSNNTQRIFTFGCSFTEYFWPTWADMILYNNDGVNYGMLGGGFEQIMSNLVQCDLDYELNSNDIVIIVFPNFLRWDLPFYPKIGCVGNMITSHWSKYINKFWSIDGIVYKNINLMYMIHTFLKNKNVTVKYSGIIDIYNYLDDVLNDVNIDDRLIKHIDRIKKEINLLSDFYTFLHNDNKLLWKKTKKWKNDKWEDMHPRPTEHYKWLNEILLPEVNVSINITNDDILIMETIINENNTPESVSESFKQTNYIKNRNKIQNNQKKLV